MAKTNNSLVGFKRLDLYDGTRDKGRNYGIFISVSGPSVILSMMAKKILLNNEVKNASTFQNINMLYNVKTKCLAIVKTTDSNNDGKIDFTHRGVARFAGAPFSRKLREMANIPDSSFRIIGKMTTAGTLIFDFNNIIVISKK